MDEHEAMVWIDSPEEVEQMPDDVRKVLEEMDSGSPQPVVGDVPTLGCER